MLLIRCGDSDEQLFVGTFDGRLIALDVDDGTVNWEVNTIDREKPTPLLARPREKERRAYRQRGADFGVRGIQSAMI